MSTKAYGRMVFWERGSLWVLGTRPGEGAHHVVDDTSGDPLAWPHDQRQQRYGSEGPIESRMWRGIAGSSSAGCNGDSVVPLREK